MGERNDTGSTTNPERIEAAELERALLQIESTVVAQYRAHLKISNALEQFIAWVDPNSVIGSEFVISPYGERCLKMDLRDNGFLIVTPNDFVFDVTQEGFVKVDNLLPMCSVRELFAGFADYEKNPEPDNNIATNVANHLFQRALIESAFIKGFDVEPLARRLNRLVAGTELGNCIQAFTSRSQITARDFRSIALKLRTPLPDYEFVELWKRYIRVKPWDFYFTLADNLPGSLVWLDLADTGQGSFKLELEAEQVRIASFEVKFDISAHTAELTDIHLNERYQCSDIFSHFMTNAADICTGMGIEKLTGHFAGESSHAAASFGFLPSQEEWFRLRAELRKRVDHLRMSDADRAKVVAILESDDPRGVQEIANLDFPYGKDDDTA